MALLNAPRPAVLTRDLRSVGRLARDASQYTWIERLARLGLVIRGIIYFVPGALALEWALGRARQPMTPASSIDLIGHQPMGRALLFVVAVGLAGYAIWGVIRAVFDPLRRGHSAAGIAQRIGYAMSAIAYLGLLAATVRLLTGSQPHVDRNQDWTVALLARPFGGVIVVAIGLCWIFGSGIAQIVMGWRKHFERDLVLERLHPLERRWAVGLGRVGIVSRGIVFTLIGVLLVAGAMHLRSGSDPGLQGALLELAHQPFGRALLAAAGFGLMAFGVYSAMCARWLRMQQAAQAPSPFSSHPHLREVSRK